MQPPFSSLSGLPGGGEPGRFPSFWGARGEGRDDKTQVGICITSYSIRCWVRSSSSIFRSHCGASLLQWAECFGSSRFRQCGLRLRWAACAAALEHDLRRHRCVPVSRSPAERRPRQRPVGCRVQGRRRRYAGLHGSIDLWCMLFRRTRRAPGSHPQVLSVQTATSLREAHQLRWGGVGYHLN